MCICQQLGVDKGSLWRSGLVQYSADINDTDTHTPSSKDRVRPPAASASEHECHCLRHRSTYKCRNIFFGGLASPMVSKDARLHTRSVRTSPTFSLSYSTAVRVGVLQVLLLLKYCCTLLAVGKGHLSVRTRHSNQQRHSLCSHLCIYARHSPPLVVAPLESNLCLHLRLSPRLQ